MKSKTTRKLNKKTGTPHSVVNRSARHDYFLSDSLEVGMILKGEDVRLIRDNHAQLKGSYVTIRNRELWLYNLTLGSKTAQNIKLLATKKQIEELKKQKKIQKITIVPTKLLPTKRHIKLIISLGKGKKYYDKRETIKKRDLERYGS